MINIDVNHIRKQPITKVNANHICKQPITASLHSLPQPTAQCGRCIPTDLGELENILNHQA